MASLLSIDHITELVFGFIEIVIIIPFLIYSLYHLHRHINEVYFIRRGKLITISWFISLTIYNIMLIIIIISYLFYNKTLSHLIFSTSTSSTIHHMIGSSSIWMNLSRCWQLYYNKKYYHGLQNTKWRSKINQNDMNFYVKYRSTIGNYKTIYSIATFLWLIDGFIFFSMSSFFKCLNCEIFAEFPSYLMFYIFASIILCSSRIDDIFFIRKELIYIISLQIIGTILSFILNIIIIYCPICDIDDIIFKNIIPSFLGCLVSIGIIYFGIHWVIKQNIKHTQQQTLYQFHHQNDDINEDMIPLKDILTDKAALDLFMQHLVREFSVENVLFLIEAVNFKRLMIKLGYINDDIVPFDFLEVINRNKFGRSSSFSMSMGSKLSLVNNHNNGDTTDSDKKAMQLSLHESIKLVQTMNDNVDTSLTSTSSFLRNLSKTTSDGKKKGKKESPKSNRKSIVEMNEINQQTRSRPNSAIKEKAKKDETYTTPETVETTNMRHIDSIISSGIAGESVNNNTIHTQFSSLLSDTPNLDQIANCTSIHTNSSTSKVQSMLTASNTLSTNITPEPASISAISPRCYSSDDEKHNESKKKPVINGITLENIHDMNAIDSDIDNDEKLNNEEEHELDTDDMLTDTTMNTNDLEEEKKNDFKEEQDIKNNNNISPSTATTTTTTTTVIDLKSPSLMRTHSISKSRSPFMFHSMTTTQTAPKQTQRQTDSIWINFPKNVPISPLLLKQKGGKYLNPWIIACDIVEKYIQNSSMLCINISWNVRDGILKFMTKYEDLYQEYYFGKKRKKSSLSITFSSLSWKRRKNKNNKKLKNRNNRKKEKSKSKSKGGSVDGSYHPLEDEEDEDEDKSLNENNNDIIDEEEVLKELAILFDASCMEIYSLLGDSYTRFVTTESYQILLKRQKNYIKQWIKKRTASVVSLNANKS